MTASPKKPTVRQVYGLLSQHRGLIVHFSGAPKGVGKDRGAAHLFPSDLLHVIDGCAQGGVSSSVVRPGDVFSGHSRNATGTVGVILGLVEPQSLVAADRKDCGSTEGPDGVRTVEEEKDIEIADLDDTIIQRETYNEWVIRNFRVIGILAVEPFEVSCLRKMQYPPEMPAHLRSEESVQDIRCASREELLSIFKNLPIYTFLDTNILSLKDLTPVYHSVIYG